MIEIDSEENVDEEFECSECDFKCLCGDKMIEHSAIHIIVPDVDVMDILHKHNSTDCNAKDKRKFNSHGKFIIHSQTDIPEIKDIKTFKSIIKSELNTYEDMFCSDGITQEHELRNKEIKLEQMDMKNEVKPYFPPQPDGINEYHDRNKYGELGMPLFVSQPDEINEYNDNFKYSNLGMPLFVPPYIYIQVENSYIYTPPGWKLQVRMKTRLCNGAIQYDCFYSTELGKEISCEEEAIEYLNINPHAEIDIKKLTFALPETKLDQSQSVLEHDIDNTGVYVPEGWQRKINIRLFSDQQINYHIIFISREGIRFWRKAQVYSHISHHCSEEYVNVELMDFSVKRSFNMIYIKDECQRIRKKDTRPYQRNITQKSDAECNKMEIQIDNTGIYIPDGWERKVYRYINGPSKGTLAVYYISPCGKNLGSKSQVLKRIEKSERKSIDIEKLDFTKPLELRKSRKFISKEEVEVDVSAMYVPEDWQIKVFRKTSGHQKDKLNICYISPFGKKIWRKKEMEEYLEQLEDENIHLLIDLTKITFGLKNCKIIKQ